MDAASNIALDAAMLKLRAQGRIPDTLRFLSFTRPAALIGCHQSPGNELRIDYCIENGFEINRRITGGGAVFFDRSQIGWELVACRESISCGPTMADLTECICRAAAAALRLLGVDAAFRPRNDIEVDGRKICGTGGAYEDGAFLFQGTLLVDFDVEAMIRALRIPTEKLLPRELSSARERVTCLREQLGEVPDREEIKACFGEAFSRAFGIDFRRGGLSMREFWAMKRLLPAYAEAERLDKEMETAGETVILHSLHRGRGGIIRAAAAVDSDRGILRGVHFSGDFFVDPRRALLDLESRLRDCRLDAVKECIDGFFRSRRPDFLGLDAADFIAALSGAFAKLYFREKGISARDVDAITLVGCQGVEQLLSGADTLLLPYCAKDSQCEQRTRDACDRCGLCGVGEAYDMAEEVGMDVVSINDFQHLVETLDALRSGGAGAFIGCCCHAFMVKHFRTFQEAGTPGLLVDIGNSTCYELSRERDAYMGEFDEQTELKLELLERLLALCVGAAEKPGAARHLRLFAGP